MRSFSRLGFVPTRAVGPAADSPQRAIVTLLLLAVAAILPASAAALPTHPPGIDRWTTQPGPGVLDFSVIPIPAGFFGPGSEPFDVPTFFSGDPVGPGNTDTAVRRLAGLDLSGPIPASDVIPIELVELHLQSVLPLTVTFLDTHTEDWDARIDVVSPVGGTLSASKTHPNGGVYTAEFFAFTPAFVFTRISDLTQLSFPILSDLSIQGTWLEMPVPGGVSTGPNFFPGPSTLTLAANGSTAVWYDDDIFSAVPEPSLSLLLLSGMAALALRCRGNRA